MKMNKTRLINALEKLILVSAVFHLILLSIYSIINLDFMVLNYFNLIDLDLFFPEILNGFMSNFYSILTIFIIFLIIYFKFTRK